MGCTPLRDEYLGGLLTTAKAPEKNGPNRKVRVVSQPSIETGAKWLLVLGRVVLRHCSLNLIIGSTWRIIPVDVTG